VFLEAWRKRSTLYVTPQGSPLPWLLKTTEFACLNALRSRQRHSRLCRRAGVTDSDLDPLTVVEERAERFELASHMRAALAQLPDQDRLALTLCVVEERAIASVADQLGVPIGTLKSRVCRGLSS
jgi:RNA polymerase sigma-70 factor (ECF subfamily)